MQLFHHLKSDLQTIFKKDPAARSIFEILCCYPGLHALWWHRIAHTFWHMKLRFIARFISHSSRFFTNIEIHPGAVIGEDFFIDHGAGVVIGETAEIGNNVLIYQGVVFGGTSSTKGKRHPTVCNDVVIGAGAILLGPIKIGNDAKVGAGSVVIRDVPAGKTVVGVPARVAGEHEHLIVDLEHAQLPDPLMDAMQHLLDEQKCLKDRIRHLEDKLLNKK